MSGWKAKAAKLAVAMVVIGLAVRWAESIRAHVAKVSMRAARLIGRSEG